MRLPALAVVTVVAAVLGGGAALGIGKGTGWLDEGTKTVVVRAQASQAASLTGVRHLEGFAAAGQGLRSTADLRRRSPGS